MISNKTIVFVETIGDSHNKKACVLNLDDKLPDIRKELEKHNTINDMLSFSIKFPKRGNDENDDYAEIVRERENDMQLKDITELVKADDNSDGYILHLMKNSRPGWNVLNEKFRLDYGRTMSFDGIKVAN